MSEHIIGSFKCKIDALYAEIHESSYNNTYNSFIESVKEEMLESVKAGNTGVVYRMKDISCKPDDFIAWLKSEGFRFHWQRSFFHDPILYVNFN